ncbi:MAG: hypothetical protein IJ134_04295 [Bacilli bacterium]|nr:hypothetical protein [Bacilli bacterium]
MDKEKINDYASKLSEALEDKIKVITSIKYHYDLEELASSINKLSENDAEVILEQLINERLEEIKNSPNKDKYRENIKSIDEITDFFIYNNDKSSSVEEGSFVVSDLINKVIGINGRNIKLPLKIEFIKDYCIRNIIDKKDIKKTLLWIVLELTVVSYYLNNVV